jgi:hypothetical protein
VAEDAMSTCAVCLKDFTPTRMGQKVCGYRCSAKIGPLARKSERQATRVAKEQQKRLPDLRKEAQKAFNDFIRARDADKPCFCCGQWRMGGEPLKGGEWDSGHFRGRGANPELAFDETNVHRQLKAHNAHDWDRVYAEAEIRRRIGDEAMERLLRPHPAKHYTRDDLRQIRDEYRAKARELARKL